MHDKNLVFATALTLIGWQCPEAATPPAKVVQTLTASASISDLAYFSPVDLGRFTTAGGFRVSPQGDVYLAYGDDVNIKVRKYTKSTGQWGDMPSVVRNKRYHYPDLTSVNGNFFLLANDFDHPAYYTSTRDSTLYSIPSGGTDWTKLVDVYIDRCSEACGAADTVKGISPDPAGNLHIILHREGWWSYGYAASEMIYNTTQNVLGSQITVSDRRSGNPDEARNVPMSSSWWGGVSYFLGDNQELVYPLVDMEAHTLFSASSNQPYGTWMQTDKLSSFPYWGINAYQDTQGHYHFLSADNSNGHLFYSYDWGTPIELVADKQMVGGSIIVKSGTVYVVFSEYSTNPVGAKNVFLMEKPKGGSWSAPVQVTSETSVLGFDLFFAKPFGYRKEPSDLYFTYVVMDGTLNGATYSGAHIKIAKIETTKQPDFSIDKITLTPSTPVANTTFSAKVTIENQGTTGDAGNLVIWSDQDDIQACGTSGNISVAIGTMNAGSKRNITVTGLRISDAGAKTMRAFVDAACVTSESDEENNQSIKPYRVHGKQPDFVISKIELSPTAPAVGSSFSASITVTNQGAKAAAAGYLDIWANAASSRSCAAEGNVWANIGNVAAGASKTLQVTLPASTVAGSKLLRAFADSWCETSESSETNNQSTVSYTVN
ncbi:hypothetical protein CCP3SC1AL1_40032 [Gammaproteobacteria bacterium]